MVEFPALYRRGVDGEHFPWPRLPIALVFSMKEASKRCPIEADIGLSQCTAP